LALLLGIASAWTGEAEWTGTEVSVLMLAAITVALALLWLIVIVVLEHRLLRYAPERLASWSTAFRGHILAPEVGLAVVRGTAIGLVLTGVQTWLAYDVMHRPRSAAGFSSGIPDPS